MAIDVFERLERIFKLEERQGWRNRSVAGGIQALSQRWPMDAAKAEVDPTLITAVVDLLQAYLDASEEDRPAIAATILAATQDPVALPELAAEVIGEPPAPPPPPAKIDPPKPSKPAKAEKPIPSEKPAKAAPSPKKAPAKQANPQPSGTNEPPADDYYDYYESLQEGYTPPEPTDAASRRARIKQEIGHAPPKRPLRDGATLDVQGLNAPVNVLPGIGKAKADLLAKLNIRTINDLLWHLPHRYDDFSALRTIDKLQPGEQVTVIANLWELSEKKLARNRSMVQGILGDGTGTLHATWWSPYVRKKLRTGRAMRFSGKVGLFMGNKSLDNPSFEPVDEDAVTTGRIVPVYPLTEGVSNMLLNKLTGQALENWGKFIDDPVPAEVMAKLGLMGRGEALQQIHFPENMAKMEAARQRLAFDEFFLIQLGVEERRRQLKSATAPSLASDEVLMASYTASLPFQLTGAQARVLGEVVQDIDRTVPMARLIQGDVGSGKTVVAAGAMVVAAANGYQSALLAPTQILAEQHFRGISALLAQLAQAGGASVRTALLTGRVTGSQRQEVLDGLADGSIDVVIGTTALIQEGVEFSSLGFVVVDEQHRFGVEQRGALRSQNIDVQPHVLVMSATPIPRSLALTVFGDLDISVIDEMPPGRTPIVTKRFTSLKRESLYGFIRKEVAQGRQAFIIYPLVEESDKLDVGSAVEGHLKLSNDIFPDLSVGLLHGRMNGAEKDTVMSAFAAGDYQILVATTVVEVGIDMPNATVMLIEDAHRFGLAQLHQLRGRVGRGQHESYCALFSDTKTPDTLERLDALVASTDGFVLAEKDLALRGPGDFLGTRQSGLPDLRVAQLSDTATLVMAREAARSVFAQDPELATFPTLRAQVDRFWQGHGDIS